MVFIGLITSLTLEEVRKAHKTAMENTLMQSRHWRIDSIARTWGFVLQQRGDEMKEVKQQTSSQSMTHLRVVSRLKMLKQV